MSPFLKKDFPDVGCQPGESSFDALTVQRAHLVNRVLDLLPPLNPIQVQCFSDVFLFDGSGVVTLVAQNRNRSLSLGKSRVLEKLFQILSDDVEPTLVSRVYHKGNCIGVLEEHFPLVSVSAIP